MLSLHWYIFEISRRDFPALRLIKILKLTVRVGCQLIAEPDFCPTLIADFAVVIAGN